MTTSGKIILELVESAWAELDPTERAAFEEWVKTARGEDLYMLLRHARRLWHRSRTSSSQTMTALRPDPDTEDKD